MNIDWVEILAFFFRAMQNGWINDDHTPWIMPPGGVLKGFKAFVFTEGPLILMDQWSKSSKSGKSAGQTVIWHHETPIWIMQFGGLYPKEVIPFLKNVLRTTYEAKIFFGGRGPAQTQRSEEGLVYINSLEPGSNFERFSGIEQIINADPWRELGYHKYQGMSLV